MTLIYAAVTIYPLKGDRAGVTENGSSGRGVVYRNMGSDGKLQEMLTGGLTQLGIRSSCWKPGQRNWQLPCLCVPVKSAELPFQH